MSDALKQRWRDPSWKYVRSDKGSDIRKTFARIKREQRQSDQQPATTVRPLRKPGAAA